MSDSLCGGLETEGKAVRENVTDPPLWLQHFNINTHTLSL